MGDVDQTKTLRNIEFDPFPRFKLELDGEGAVFGRQVFNVGAKDFPESSFFLVGKIEDLEGMGGTGESADRAIIPIVKVGSAPSGQTGPERRIRLQEVRPATCEFLWRRRDPRLATGRFSAWHG